MLNLALHLVCLLVGEGEVPLAAMAHGANQERGLVGTRVVLVLVEHRHGVLHLGVIVLQEDDVVDVVLHAEEHAQRHGLLLA